MVQRYGEVEGEISPFRSTLISIPYATPTTKEPHVDSALSGCRYHGKCEQGEDDCVEAEAKRLNKAWADRLRRSSGDWAIGRGPSWATGDFHLLDCLASGMAPKTPLARRRHAHQCTDPAGATPPSSNPAPSSAVSTRSMM